MNVCIWSSGEMLLMGEKIGVLGKRLSQCHIVLHGEKLAITA